jgi:hypothetical protein
MITANVSIEVCDPKMQETKGLIWKITLLILCLMLVACGTTPAVNESRYTSVQIQIDNAKKIEADDYAGKEIFAAQKNLEDARKADENGDREKALQLLKEAELHAQLAESRATSAHLQKRLDEVNAGLATLQKELKR